MEEGRTQAGSFLAPDDPFLDTLASACGVPLPELCRPGVKSNLAVAARMAALLATVPLSDNDFALAPAFRPLAPDAAGACDSSDSAGEE